MPLALAAGALAGVAAGSFRSEDGSKVATAEEAKLAFLAQNKLQISPINSPSPTSPLSAQEHWRRKSSDVAPNAIRVYTKGSNLGSGFPYHPALFDAEVHPSKWEAFTTQVVESTKLSGLQKSSAMAASILSAGPLPLARMVGRQASIRLQESKVKSGLQSTSDGGLGEILQRWNYDYFEQRGLAVRLEFSEAAMKRNSKQSPILVEDTHWHLKKDDRDRVKQERKFVLVVDRTEGLKTGAFRVPAHDVDANSSVFELEDGSGVSPTAVEASGDAPAELVELPADSEYVELPGESQYAELEADNKDLLAKGTLMVTADAHAKINS